MAGGRSSSSCPGIARRPRPRSPHGCAPARPAPPPKSTAGGGWPPAPGATAAQLAERLRASAPGATPKELGRRRLTASFGVAQAAPGEPASAVLQRADAALYRAKSLGRDRVEIEG